MLTTRDPDGRKLSTDYEQEQQELVAMRAPDTIAARHGPTVHQARITPGVTTRWMITLLTTRTTEIGNTYLRATLSPYTMRAGGTTAPCSPSHASSPGTCGSTWRIS